MSPITDQQRLETRNSGRKYLLIPAWILLMAIMALGVVQSGKPANLVDPTGFLFVLVGGIALVMISFSGAEIQRAFHDALASPGHETDIRSSVHFWEAAGRGFWILGVLRSILHLVIYMQSSLKTQETAGIQLFIRALAQYLLVSLYGILLAMICFIPCWILIGRLRSRPSAPVAQKTPVLIGRSGWRFGLIFGYALFLASLALSSHKLQVTPQLLLALKPAVFVVLGGAIALILFSRTSNLAGPTPSSAFAALGLVGSLIGSIQMLFSVSVFDIAQLAGALAFLISSCLTALLGIVLVGAPLEDRAVRSGQIPAPSAFSRIAWYVCPLLALIFLIPMIFLLWGPAK